MFKLPESLDLKYWKYQYKLAMMFAARAHALKSYGTYHYYMHLLFVEEVLLENGFDEETVENYQFRIEAYLHDIIEDGGYNFNDISKMFDENIAETTYRVSEGKGKNRKERKPPEYYIEIGKDYHSSVIKIADRISNIEKGDEKRMLEMYIKEQKDFSLIRKTNEEVFVSIPKKLDNLWNVLLKTLEEKKEYFDGKK